MSGAGSERCARELPQWRRALCVLSCSLPAPAQRGLGGTTAHRVRRERLRSTARKNYFGLPACLAQCERGACNLPGKVAFLKMSTVRCCPQNTTGPALEYQPVAMKLSPLGVVVRESAPSPAHSSAGVQLCYLTDHFSPQTSFSACLHVPCAGGPAQRGVTGG